MRKIYIITDLGPDNGGKGSISHALAQKVQADIVIKHGGLEGIHSVYTSNGENFDFSQWGCGTLEKIPTYLSEQMVVSPLAMLREADALKTHGIKNPFSLITASPDCIVTTPYHIISSEIEKLLVNGKPQKTISSGMGQAIKMNQEEGKTFTLKISELRGPEISRMKLKKQFDYYCEKYSTITGDEVEPENLKFLDEKLELIYSNDLFSKILDRFENVGQRINFKTMEDVLRKNDTAIVECSHGVLSDAEVGLEPRAEMVRTLPEFVEKMFRSHNYAGEIINYAIRRAYEIRYCAGLLPTYDGVFTRKIFNGDYDNYLRTATIRAGALDLEFTKKAIEDCKNTNFDGLCITCFDQILKTDRQWAIGRGNKGEFTSYFFKDATTNREVFERADRISRMLFKLPLKILSIGPTEVDKIYSHDLD